MSLLAIPIIAVLALALVILVSIALLYCFQSFREKVAVMKRMFPRHAGKIAVSNSNKVFDILIEF